MKKLVIGLLATTLTACASTSTTAVSTAQPTSTPTAVPAASVATTIQADVDLGEYGAESVQGLGDHDDSIYFPKNDYFNMQSNDHLTILSNFKTYQQTSEWSCGVAAVLMTLNYYNKLDNYNELSLAEMRDNKLEPAATTLASVVNMFETVGGFKVESTHDYKEDEIHDKITMEMVQNYLKEGVPVLVCWNDWGGHWQVIIGYDDMSTPDYPSDDVIIVADPYDTTDHHQDGYGVYGAERFYYNWTMYDFFNEQAPGDRDLLFVAPRFEK